MTDMLILIPLTAYFALMASFFAVNAAHPMLKLVLNVITFILFLAVLTFSLTILISGDASKLKGDYLFTFLFFGLAAALSFVAYEGWKRSA